MVLIPANINKANEYLLRLAKLFQQKMKTEQTNSNNNRGSQFKQSIKFNPPPLDINSINNHSGNSKKRTPRIK